MNKVICGGFFSKARVVCLGVLILCFSFCAFVQATQSITLAWNPETGTNVAGYALYYGTNTASYSYRIDTGTNASATATGLKEGLVYYFAIAAYNPAHQESAPSAPLNYLVPGMLAMVPPSKSTPMQIKFPVAPGHSYTVQASVDLKNWTNVWNSGTSSSNAWVTFQDSQSGSFAKRFYRLTTP